MKQTKSLLRKQLKSVRGQFHSLLNEKEYEAVHFQIALNLKMYIASLEPSIQERLIIGGFYPIRDEVNCLKIIDYLKLRDTSIICLPVHFNKQEKKPLIFREMQGEMEKGEYGILVPPQSAQVYIPNLILTPFLGFDNDTLQRIGYGGGYFDRTIAQFRRKGITHKFVGIGFECQRYPSIPTEDNDMSLDAVITENRIYTK